MILNNTHLKNQDIFNVVCHHSLYILAIFTKLSRITLFEMPMVLAIGNAISILKCKIDLISHKSGKINIIYPITYIQHSIHEAAFSLHSFDYERDNMRTYLMIILCTVPNTTESGAIFLLKWILKSETILKDLIFPSHYRLASSLQRRIKMKMQKSALDRYTRPPLLFFLYQKDGAGSRC